jgi:hypothetical protein
MLFSDFLFYFYPKSTNEKTTFYTRYLFFCVIQTGCKKSKCTNVSCYNGGTCDENTGQCKCTANFTGSSCSDVNGDTVAYLIMKFHFDSTMTRLDNFGNPTTMPAGHAGQHPDFKGLSQHYIELAQSAFTQLGTGVSTISCTGNYNWRRKCY